MKKIGIVTITELDNFGNRLQNYALQEVLKRKAVVEANKEKYGDAYIDNDYVSCTEVGNPRGETSINTALTRLCVNNGIKHISVHGLRHCYASILLEQGYELPIISGAYVVIQCCYGSAML